jgi:DNA-binding NarL/FixJ family response regulator
MQPMDLTLNPREHAAITLHGGTAFAPLRAAPMPTILVIDDHELFRMGLCIVLNDARSEPVALLEADCLRAGMALYAERDAGIDLVVLDLNLPDGKGLYALETFRRAHPAARIVALTETVDAAVAEEARALGAEAVLHKACGADAFRELAVAARRPLAAAHDGWPGAMPPVTDCVSAQLRLTPRQVKILDLVLQGHPNQEIGAVTGLKTGTVKNHISWLLVVFGVPSRSRLISLFR